MRAFLQFEGAFFLFNQKEKKVMNEKEIYFIKRRRKNISQKTLAEYLNCSQSLISRYETDDGTMCKAKIQLYKEYIDKK